MQVNSAKSRFNFILILASACIVFALMQGIRDSYGIMLRSIISATSISYSDASFAIALGQILYGVLQPFFGILALRKSNSFVMLIGIALMALGLIATPLCTSFVPLLLFFGIILPSGTAALCFGIIMATITPLIGERKAAFASGILQASAGVGDCITSPALQFLISSSGLALALRVLALPLILTIPIVLYIGKKNNSVIVEKKDNWKKEKLSCVLGKCIRNPSYYFLLLGFSTCGFHMSIIETHLFSMLVSEGLSETLSSLTLTVYGIFTMLGAILTGFLGLKFKFKNVLATVYFIRIFIDFSFIILPKSVPFAFIATALLGITGDSTVPPTTNIISRKWEPSRMAIIYGSIFIGHQIGAFSSSYIGSVVSYSTLWTIDLGLCLMASILSFMIKIGEKE